jgi:predicted PurR-regulated permease PerM
MLTLVGAFAGVRLFGIVGAFLGPLILSYVFELVAVYEETIFIDSAPPPSMPTDSTPAMPALRDASQSRVHT